MYAKTSDRGPTLVLARTRDLAFPIDEVRRLGERIPGALREWGEGRRARVGGEGFVASPSLVLEENGERAPRDVPDTWRTYRVSPSYTPLA